MRVYRVLQNLCNRNVLTVMIELYCCVLATTLPNKEGSWVLGLQGSVAKILQNPVRAVCGVHDL